MKTNPCLVLLCSAALLAGCTLVRRNYLYQPGPIERANPALSQSKQSIDYENLKAPTDAHILAFTNALKSAFRGRMNTAAVMRHVSATTQVLTAAAAATLSALEGSSKDVITILAASSSVMPQLQSVFDARGAAIALQQGAALIDEAEAAYYLAIAKNPAAKPGERLTPEGAQLYVKTVAAVQIVEALLMAHLPTLDQMKTVKGETAAALAAPDQNVRIELAAPTKDDQGKAVFAPVGSQAAVPGYLNVLVATSADLSVATVDKGDHFVTITAKKNGQTVVTAGLSDGSQRTFTVIAYVPLSLDAGKLALVGRGHGTIKATNQRIADARIDAESVADVTAATETSPVESITVTSKVDGPAMTVLFLRGEYGGSQVVPVVISKTS